MRIYRSLGLAVAVGMVAAAMSPVAVHASQPDPVAANVLSALSSQTDQVLDSMWSSDVRNLSVENGRVTSTSNGGTQVQISLPGHPTMQELKGDLTTHVTSGDRFTSSVEDAGSGAFRALIHIPDNSAPREYRFEFGEENQLVPLEDGGVTIRDSLNNQVGSVAAPWAVDAQGQPVETKFEIDGSTLVQRVLFTSGTTFPVVADPFWIPALLVLGHLTRHAVTQAAARGISHALIRQVVQHGVRTAGNRGTSVFTQGTGANRIRVIVDNRTGNIITVTKG